MEKVTPMDRLVCGDVGFGKTEVAMRAAFKAAISGYQVAILAPTTILAAQHYATNLRPQGFVSAAETDRITSQPASLKRLKPERKRTEKYQ